MEKPWDNVFPSRELGLSSMAKELGLSHMAVPEITSVFPSSYTWVFWICSDFSREGGNELFWCSSNCAVYFSTWISLSLLWSDACQTHLFVPASVLAEGIVHSHWLSQWVDLLPDSTSGLLYNTGYTKCPQIPLYPSSKWACWRDELPGS